MRRERFLEYRGGYSLVPEGELLAVIKGYRMGVVKKDTIRIFAAMQEKRALHEKSKVDIFRILNCKSKENGLKRLGARQVREGETVIASVFKDFPSNSAKVKAVSRVTLRAIAQGRMTCTEAIVLFMYALRRISQKKALRRLLPNERYARFTFRDLSELSGIPRANICRAVASLKEKSFLQTVWVVKQNENQFGLLFVDGQLLSLVPGAAADRSEPEKRKTTTPAAQNANTPLLKTTTLINSYPKTVLKENKPSSLFVEKERRESDWERIKRRAKAMEENASEQAA